MSIPGFRTEASLSKSRGHYRSVARKIPAAGLVLSQSRFCARLFDRCSDGCTKYCSRSDPLAAAICADCVADCVTIGDFCEWIASIVPWLD
jgi:hypothetical protein